MGRRFEPQDALGMAIRKLRTERGWKQREVERAADMSDGTISRLENGFNNPEWGTVARVAAAFGLRVSEFAALAEDLAAQERRRRSRRA
jgi:transcriptional regulator with XRE-family HTH domain